MLALSAQEEMVADLEMKTTEPNHALEPTTMLGTSAAEQPWVPNTVVAQL